MSTMQFSEETIKTLNKAMSVNQSIRLVEGEDKIRTKTTNNDMLMIAPIDETFERDVNIYNLKEFLEVLRVIDKPNLDFSNDKLIKMVSDDKKQKLNYVESEAEFVKSYTDKTPKMKDPEIKLKITEEQMASVLNGRKIMKLENVGFVCDGETISLSAFNKNNGDGSTTNDFSIEICEGDEKFEMFYKFENQDIDVLLDEGDLDFEISAKSKISKIETASGKVFWIAMNNKSTYGE